MRTALMLACFAAACAYAQQANAVSTKWEIEQGVEVPSYAVAEPTATDLNIDTVVLGCEQAGKGKVLQLQLYLSDDGRLRPIGVSPAGLTDDPQASICDRREPIPRHAHVRRRSRAFGRQPWGRPSAPVGPA